MKKSIPTKLLSLFLATLMLVLSVVTVYAADSGKGKYVTDVFIAYGEDLVVIFIIRDDRGLVDGVLTVFDP